MGALPPGSSVVAVKPAGSGVRTGAEMYDEHRIDNLLLVAGSEHKPRPVTVEVSSNGQQFSTSAVELMYEAPPTVSAFFPERGPQTGSTVVRVLGANFGAGAHYMCRFDGITVDASYDVANSTIHCTSVPRATARAAPLEVSLNSQQYTNSSYPFVFYEPPTVVDLTPAAGIFYGKSSFTVRGANLLPVERVGGLSAERWGWATVAPRVRPKV